MRSNAADAAPLAPPLPVRHFYAHVPFCARRCSYCDFSIAVRAVTPVDEYVHALRAELRRYDTSAWALETVYLGGGTPSRLGGAGVAHALDVVRDVARITDDAEITIEANPDDVTEEDARRWRAAGVNRVSLGVQSFDPRVLHWMHRTHGAEQSARAVDALRTAGIANISVDLIFSVPPALERDWERDVRLAIALGVEHLSLYGLTVEEGTPLGRWRERGTVVEATDETYATDFLHAHAALTAAGFEHYEVSNYGKPGHASRHNQGYWSGVPYVGAGPAAHGFDGEVRRWNVAPYVAWVRRLAAGESVVAGRERLTSENREVERVYLGLRTRAGVPASAAQLQAARPWVDAGWITIRDRTIVATPDGWLRLDTLAASLTLAGSH